MIHVFGNSHAWFFTGRNEARGVMIEDDKPMPGMGVFNVHPLGPCTAWTFGEKHAPTVYRMIENNNIQPGDTIMFTIGEIDCRWHILNNFKGKDLWSDVCRVVERYVNGLHQFTKDFNVVAWGVHPPGGNGHDPGYPRYGSVAHRMIVTEMFNARLADGCASFGINFASIYWQLVNEEHSKYYLDEIHLGQAAMPFALKALDHIIKGSQ